MTIYVVRSDKHTQEIQRMSLADAVNELATMMPASIYNSRLEILADLTQKRQIETLGYLYELTASDLDAALLREAHAYRLRVSQL